MKTTIEYKIRVDKDVHSTLSKELNIPLKDLKSLTILRESIDARDKSNVLYNYLLSIDTKTKIPKKYLRPEPKFIPILYKEYSFKYRPVIVGFGPAGIFLSLYLARINAKPIIIERGDEVPTRQNKIDLFFKDKILDTESNVVFGEGGAGTFSDGKLQTNLNSPLIRFILEEFVKHGANPDILTSNLPHIGTDILAKVIPNIKKEIIELGGSFYFNTKFIDYHELDDYLEVITNKESFKTKHLILAIGHSARDTFKMLYDKGIKMEAKPFSVGLRIEHLQNNINYSQFGSYAKYLKPAYYKLNVHLKDRGVYTFCMCPGGYVIPSQNEENSIVTNGMSYNKRDGLNANSALLVEVRPEDYYKGHPLDGFDFINEIETKAYNISKDYKAPANLVKEFLNDEVAKEERTIKSTYPHGVIFSDLSKIFPQYVIDSLKEALPLLNNKLKGFSDDDAILVAPETRSSCPVRIVREEYKTSNKYIYAVGEGSGYSGGITSSALDGLKCALKIVEGDN